MKKIALIIFLTICITKLYGQDEAFKDIISFNMTKQLMVFPHEKIYLHTDKPYYITGEKIYFRAFLLDAFSNQTVIASRYVYVELINPADSVVKRVKIKPDEDYLFHGAIHLPEDLTVGNYKIRAYTQYMQNQYESSFFYKYVKISDPQILSIQPETDFQFTEDGRINVSLRFIEVKTNEILKPQSVNLRLNKERPFTNRPDRDGWFRFRLNIPEKVNNRALYVETLINNRIFKQYLRIPYPENDFDVSFYPEGGHIIAGQLSNVAFKAVNSGGAAIDIDGNVVDSKGNIVADFKTYHEGMGFFFITPSVNETYHAVCRYGNITLKFDLPEIKTDAYAIKTANMLNNLLIAINKNNSNFYPELYLLIHSRGMVCYNNKWDFSKEFITFDKTTFPSGVNHILLLTKDLQIISERLVFINNDDNVTAEFTTQKDSYKKREHIQAGIKLKNTGQQALKGNFSIVITNDNVVLTDTTSGILSEILLRSELKGHIENPEFYFQKGNRDAENAADLLMKTHGWTRYAIPDVIRGELTYPKISFEKSQNISGIVKSGLLSKPAKDFKVSLISLDAGFFDVENTNDNGLYSFTNFEFPDSSKFVIQALNSKGKGAQMTELYVDDEKFPKINLTLIEPLIKHENTNPQLLDYVVKADLHYTYENGMRMINLPEVNITAFREDKRKYKSNYYSSPDFSFSEEDIESSGANIMNLFYRVPGVRVIGDNISIRGARGAPLVVIDDVPYTLDEGENLASFLSQFSFNIGQLDVLKDIGNLAIFGSRGGNGVIVIHTKKGEIGTSPTRYNLKQVIPLGYQMPVEFYSPKYDSQESINDPNPDFRTTIYWKPNVITDDEGNVKLDFYTADDPATYSVIIEGICDDGKLIHYRGNSIITVR